MEYPVAVPYTQLVPEAIGEVVQLPGVVPDGSAGNGQLEGVHVIVGPDQEPPALQVSAPPLPIV